MGYHNICHSRQAKKKFLYEILHSKVMSSQLLSDLKLMYMSCCVVMGEGISRSRISLCCEHQQWDRITKQSIQVPLFKKKMMLSSIITLIVEKILPESFQKDLFLNYKQSSQYRTYNSIVPDYLHDRPKTVISHSLERRAKH